MKTENRTLAGLLPGQTARVQGLALQGTIRSRLLDIGMIPGAAVTCVQQGGGIAAYRICGAVIALRGRDAAGVVIA